MYLIFLLALLIIFLCENRVKNSKTIYYIFGIVIIFFLSIIHEEVGTDSRVYKKIFDESLNFKNEFELVRSGFLLRELMFFLKKIGATYIIFRIIIINIILWLFVYSINKLFKKEERIYIYILFFSSGLLLNYSLNGVKQGLAMALYYFAICQNNKKFKYLIYTFAVLIHNLLIILLFLGFIVKKMNRRFLGIFFIITFLLGKYIKNILLFISEHIPKLKYYLHYFREDAYGVSYNFFNYFEYQIPFIVLYLIHSYEEETPKRKNMLKMFYLQVLLVNLLISQKVAATRLAAFFCLYQFFAYYFILDKMLKKKNKKIVFILICIVFFIVRVSRWEYLFFWNNY